MKKQFFSSNFSWTVQTQSMRTAKTNQQTNNWKVEYLEEPFLRATKNTQGDGKAICKYSMSTLNDANLFFLYQYCDHVRCHRSPTQCGAVGPRLRDHGYPEAEGTSDGPHPKDLNMPLHRDCPWLILQIALHDFPAIFSTGPVPTFVILFIN